jgi:hypothetical protein
MKVGNILYISKGFDAENDFTLWIDGIYLALVAALYDVADNAIADYLAFLKPLLQLCSLVQKGVLLWLVNSSFPP